MIDWSTIIINLRFKTGSLESLARDINSCPVHLRRISRDEVKEPKFSTGVRLLDLHSDHFPEKHREMKI